MKFSLDNLEETEPNNNNNIMEGSSSPLRTSSMITTRRPRPSSSSHRMTTTTITTTPTTTPNSSNKRTKLDLSSIVVYPTNIPLPSKCTITALYESALQEGTRTNVNVVADIDNDQSYLKPAGILSLEQVLLPALGLQEERALKKLQAKVQRDAPEQYKLAVETCRRLVRQSMANAMVAVQDARRERMQVQQERRQQRVEQRRRDRHAKLQALQEAQDQQAQERQRQREVDRRERIRVLQRQHPRNQDLWKEVVVLTSSLTQLEKEERMWIQAEQEFFVIAQDKSSSTSSVPQSDEEDAIVTIQAPKDPLQDQTEQTLQDIVLASTRIQQGLGMVLEILEESEQVRQDLYQKYRKDHQFHGYHGVRNPRGLIRFLSQED